MFNIEGSELIFLLLIALVVLGPEKLPEAVRKFTKGYAEFKKMASGFQGELRDVLDEPMRELRGTADAIREAAKFEVDLEDGTTKSGAERTAVSEIKREPGLNFGSANPKQAAPTPRRETGLNFGSANPRRQTRIARADDTAAAEPAADAPSTAASGADSTAPDAPAAAEDTTE